MSTRLEIVVLPPDVSHGDPSWAFVFARDGVTMYDEDGFGNVERAVFLCSREFCEELLELGARIAASSKWKWNGFDLVAPRKTKKRRKPAKKGKR